MGYAHVLLSDDAAKRALNQEGASDPKLQQITDALEAASEEVNGFLERIIIRGAWIEYHEVSRTEPSVIRLLHWPPVSPITEIAEDSNRAYGSSTVLTEGTDFLVDYNTGKITRLSGDSPTSWLAGFEPIRVKFNGGWTLENVPPKIKKVVGEYMARIYTAEVEQSYAFQTVNDARGTVTHFGPVMLTLPMRKRLADYKDFGSTTCVRYTSG